MIGDSVGYLFSPQVEMHVIGALLVDTECLQECCNILKPRDFGVAEFAVIWEILSGFAIEGKPFSIFEIAEKAKTPKFKDVETTIWDVLKEINVAVVSSANVVQHARIIKEYSVRRDLQRYQHSLTMQIEDTSIDVEKILLEMETRAAAMRGAVQSSSGLRLVPPKEWILDALEAYAQTVYRGESTGWASLDKNFMVGPGQVTGVTGIPNHGKSEFLDALMLNLAVKSGWKIVYWSPENNPRKRHVQKLSEKKVGKYLFGSNRMTFEEYRDSLVNVLGKHFEWLEQSSNGATFDQVLMEIGKVFPRPQAAVIDPWNRLEVPQDAAGSETEYIRRCLTRAARFAASTGIHLFIVAHPQKLQKNKEGKIGKPTLYDISGSAHWYNILDNGILVWRDFKEYKTEIHMLKVRFKDNGQPGMTPFKYEMHSGRYNEWTEADSFSEGTEPPPLKGEKAKHPNVQGSLPLNDQDEGDLAF